MSKTLVPDQAQHCGNDPLYWRIACYADFDVIEHPVYIEHTWSWRDSIKFCDSTTDESKTEDDATTESETETAVASTENEITFVYETSFGKTVFADALQVCTDKGMTLPIIRHEKQLTLLVEFLKSKSLPDTWMHAMAEPEPLADTKRKWFWLDSQGNLNENDPVIVSTWETGEPSNSGGIEVHISAHLTDESKYPSGMKWNDLAGWEHHRYFVCQKETIAMTDDK